MFNTLSNLNGDKALAQDSFSMTFQQCCWDFVKEEMMGFFREFHEQSKIVKKPRCNAFGVGAKERRG